MKIYGSVTEIIGNTPLIRLSGFEKKYGLKSHIAAKLEAQNPAGSAKDRIAKYMIDDAEKSGMLRIGGTIIEPTSGNTGIGLAAVAAAKGYKAVFTMPDTMSAERIKLLTAYGAEVVLTPGALGMKGAIDKARELSESIDGSVIPGQFENPANPKAHYETTGPEIWSDTDGRVDIFVSAIGTGGTVSGVGKFLKEKSSGVKIFGVEPSSSPVLSGGKSGPHKIQGIGAGFIPDTLNLSIVDEIITITNEEAYDSGREIATLDGVLVGISSGAALCAARKIAERPENSGKLIVVLLTDTGDRYLSTDGYYR